MSAAKVRRVLRPPAWLISDVLKGLDRVPVQFRQSLKLYVLEGSPPGQFLSACIENNLLTAICHADPEAAAALKPIVVFLYNYVPSPAWGSPEKRAAWQAHNGGRGWKPDG